LNGKGKGVTEWETINDLAKGMAMERRQAVKEYVGPVPARSIRMTPDDKAQKYLPDFHTRGKAIGPVGLAYWIQLLQERGPKGAFKQFGREMVRLDDSDKHWSTGITASSPAQQRQTALLRQQGSHGTLKPPTGGG
jgi:hypothetical protein